MAQFESIALDPSMELEQTVQLWITLDYINSCCSDIDKGEHKKAKERMGEIGIKQLSTILQLPSSAEMTMSPHLRFPP